jgi:hypothetical protein
MTNCYREVLHDLRLSKSSQGPNHAFAWMFLTLSALADAEDRAPVQNTYSNVYHEVLYRLQPFDGHAYTDLSRVFGVKGNR